MEPPTWLWCMFAGPLIRVTLTANHLLHPCMQGSPEALAATLWHERMGIGAAALGALDPAQHLLEAEMLAQWGRRGVQSQGAGRLAVPPVCLMHCAVCSKVAIQSPYPRPFGCSCSRVKGKGCPQGRVRGMKSWELCSSDPHVSQPAAFLCGGAAGVPSSALHPASCPL